MNNDQVIHCVDVLTGMSRLSGGIASLVFADPPYNIGIDYGRGAKADKLSPLSYAQFVAEWLLESERVLMPGGSAWVLVNEANADLVGGLMSELIGPRRNRIVWRETFGQYREGNFTPGHRHLFYHVKLGAPHIWRPDDIRVPSQRMLNGDKRAAGPRVPDDVWIVPRLCGTFKERVTWHPAQLPSMPLERIVKVATRPGQTIVEPFAGSGSLALVAKRLGRSYIGFDNNPEFARLANERIAACEVESVPA